MSNPTLDSEIYLVKGCLKGDTNAQKRLYYTYANKMYAVCLRYGGTDEDARDLLQEGFIKVYQNLPRFEYRGSLEGWIRRIMINTSIEFLRKKARLIQTEDIGSNHLNHCTDYEYRTLEVKDIMTYLTQLPEGCRLIFNLYVVEGYKHTEIAGKLGISVGTSKSQLNKARKKLQKLMTEYERY